MKKRSTTVERSFGDSKENHGYRWTKYKGVEKNQAYTHLICAAQNMKNIAIKQDKINRIPLSNSNLLGKSLENIQNLLKLIFLKMA